MLPFKKGPVFREDVGERRTPPPRPRPTLRESIDEQAVGDPVDRLPGGPPREFAVAFKPQGDEGRAEVRAEVDEIGRALEQALDSGMALVPIPEDGLAAFVDPLLGRGLLIKLCEHPVPVVARLLQKPGRLPLNPRAKEGLDDVEAWSGFIRRQETDLEYPDIL
jgi:hypothetical protein